MFEIIVKSDNLLGECPIWCPRTHRLFWTNILGGELLAYGMAHEVAQLDEKSYLEVFQPTRPRPAAKKKARA